VTPTVPFKSEAQRRLFYAKAKRGEISQKVLKEWEDATGSRKLPKHVKAKNRALRKAGRD
jgi:hypothetical protein